MEEDLGYEWHWLQEIWKFRLKDGLVLHCTLQKEAIPGSEFTHNPSQPSPPPPLASLSSHCRGTPPRPWQRHLHPLREGQNAKDARLAGLIFPSQWERRQRGITHTKPMPSVATNCIGKTSALACSFISSQAQITWWAYRPQKTIFYPHSAKWLPFVKSLCNQLLHCDVRMMFVSKWNTFKQSGVASVLVLHDWKWPS